MHLKSHLVLPFLLAVPLLAPAQTNSVGQPNVVVIISDDGGYADWEFMDDYLQSLNPGQAPSPVPTPHLNMLRERGVLFTNGYTASTCSPSRAALVTGSYQQRIGYEYNINNLPAADAIDGMSPDTVTIFDRMKAEGYTTGAIGKWHIGARANDFGLGNRPENQGVDEFFGIWKGSRSYTVGSESGVGELRRTIADPFSDTVLEATAPWNTTYNYVTSAFAQGAMQFIDDHYADPEPFFLYVAFTAPHGPIGPSPDYNDPRITGITDTKRRQYASMVLTMDKEIGNILDKLDDPAGDGSVSLTDNTLVVFINDNGGASGNGTVNTPLNNWKGSTYEGGNRVPILMAGPGIPGNPSAPLSFHKPVHSMDILPTCVAAAGGAPIPDIDGVDLVPFLDGSNPGDPHELITIRNSQKVAVRKGDWKLTKSPNNVAYALFNLASDIGESNDLSASSPAKVAELQRDFTAFEAGSDKPRFVGLRDPADSINYNDHFLLAPQSTGGSTSFVGDGTIPVGGATRNGNFNAGGGSGSQDYSATPNWENLGSGGAAANATNDNKDTDGTRNAIISQSSSRLPAVDTGHDLSAGEVFQVTYEWLDASASWDDATGRIRINLFTTVDDTITGTATTIQSIDSTLSQVNDGYQNEAHVFSAIPAAVAGKRLFLSISTAQSGSGFARVDNLVLERGTLSGSGGTPDFLDWSDAGAWTDTDTGLLDTLLEFDAFPGAVLEFPTTNNFSYTATNDMTRISELEFMLNQLRLSGSFSGTSAQSASINGNALLLTDDLTGKSPEILLAADGPDFSYGIGNELILYHDLLITGDGTADFEITGSLRDYHNEPRNLRKEGNATLLLSGPHPYSGTTTIAGGTLLLSAGASLSSAVVIEAGGTLSGNGNVIGGITGPGVVSPGQSTGTLATAANASPDELIIEIDGTGHDLFEVGGNLDLTSTSLSLLDLGGGFTETSYIIASYGSRTGTFTEVSGLPAGYIIDYQFDDGATTKHIALVDSSSLTAYQIWTTGSVLGGSDAAFGADPNADGIANGLAFFLGAPDANVSAIDLLPMASLAGASIIFRFDRADTAADLDFAVEYSSNLSLWTAAQDGVDGVSIETDDNGALDEITVSLPVSLAEAAALFARLGVSE